MINYLGRSFHIWELTPGVGLYPHLLYSRGAAPEGWREWKSGGRGDRRRFPGTQRKWPHLSPGAVQGPFPEAIPCCPGSLAYSSDCFLWWRWRLSLSCPLQCFDDNLRPASHHSILVLGLQGWETLLGPTLWFSIWKPRAKNLAKVTHRGVAKPPRDSKVPAKLRTHPRRTDTNLPERLMTGQGGHGPMSLLSWSVTVS